MIVHSNKIIWSFKKVESFNDFANKKIYRIEKGGINTPYPSEDREIICFIPVFGEEELNSEWLIFFEALGANKSFIGFKLFIYILGTNEPIQLDLPIFKQIKYFCKYLSLDYYIFPFKLYEASNLSGFELFSFYTQSQIKKRSVYKELISNATFESKDSIAPAGLDITDTTSIENGFYSILRPEENHKYVSAFLEECTSYSLIINRAKINNSDIKIHKENSRLKRLHLISNNLQEVPDFSKLINLEVLNLTANSLINVIVGSNLPKKIKVLNFSKNRACTLVIEDSFPELEKLVLFNNEFDSFNLDTKFFPSLKYLNIGRIKKIKVLPEFIYSLKQLEFLCLSYLKIEQLDERILSMPKLKYIDIRGLSSNLNNQEICTILIRNGIKVIC